MPTMLFTIREVDRKPGRAILLPGVARSTLENPIVRELRPGARLRLSFPDRTSRVVTLLDYGIRVPHHTHEPLNVNDLPITLTISDFDGLDIPEGTSVFMDSE